MPPPEKLKRKFLTPDTAEADRGNTICPFHHFSTGGVIKSSSSYDQIRKLQHKLLTPSQTRTETDGQTDGRTDEQG